MKITVAAVNKALASKHGVGAVEILKGDGYFYFVGTDRRCMYDVRSIMVPRAADLGSVASVVAHIDSEFARIATYSA